MKKWSLVLTLVVIVAALVGWSLWDSGRLVVDVIVVQRGAVESVVDERAVTELETTYVVTMPFSGMHTPAQIEEGDSLEQGTLLATVSLDDMQQEVLALQAVVDRVSAQIEENEDSRLERLVRQQAEQFVESMNFTVEAAVVCASASEERMQFAERAFGREKRLYDDAATSEDRLERRQLDFIESQKAYSQDNLLLSSFRAIQAATNLLPGMVDDYVLKKNLSTNVLQRQLEEAKAQLAIATQQMERARITSPIGGVVLSHEDYHAQYLPAGTELLAMGDLDDLQIRAEILSQDVTAVSEGDDVTIYGAALNAEPETGVTGQVSEIAIRGETTLSSLNVEQTRVDVIVKPDSASLSELRRRDVGVNYQLRIRIVTEAADDALVVPRSAIFRGDDRQWQLFAIRSGKARIIPVSVGIMNDQQVQILEGLEEGDRVVIAPESQLSNGSRVRLRR